MLANLFMHYAFDAWMAREYPNVQFERYVDDVVVHCRSESQARHVRDAIAARLAQVGLELHPDKTGIVYCKDADRRGDHEATSFVFLGYEFRPRLAKNKHGKHLSPPLADVVPALLTALGFPSQLAVPDAVCVLLIDGLGWELLAEHAAHAPVLAATASAGWSIVAGFPATTATSLANIRPKVSVQSLLHELHRMQHLGRGRARATISVLNADNVSTPATVSSGYFGKHQILQRPDTMQHPGGQVNRVVRPQLNTLQTLLIVAEIDGSSTSHNTKGLGPATVVLKTKRLTLVDSDYLSDVNIVQLGEHQLATPRLRNYARRVYAS